MKVRIPNDISKYKPKDIGNFSLIECAYIVVALCFVVLGWKLFGKIEYGLPFAVVVLVFGFFKPCNMSVPLFIRTVLKEAFSPRIYPYASEFRLKEEDKDLFPEDYRYEYQTDETLTPRSDKINKKDKQEIF